MDSHDIVEKKCKEVGWEIPIELKRNWFLSADRRHEPVVIEYQPEEKRINYYNYSGTLEV